MTRLLVVCGLIAGSCAGQELKVVKNAPFSATAVTQTVQTLADGNTITRTTTALIARDSEGRSRREQSPVVFIHDPLAGVAWILDSRTRTTRRIAVSSTDAGSNDVASTDHPTIGSSSLGSDVIAGVSVEGTRLTRAIAPGDAGNERAIQVTTEAWYSKELQTAVATRTTDPRVGETVYKLTEIKRGEPDRSLFEIPADYSPQEELKSPGSVRRSDREK